MNMLFLCGSLEPGKDGVGDYTRRLAGAMLEDGIKVSIIALDDAFINTVVFDTQYENNFNIPVLRIPAQIPINAKIEKACKWVESHKSDWVSLQYVPYAFHYKGLPFKWITRFKKIAPDSKWHMMMHELWIGNKKTEPLKNKLVGFVQQKIISATIASIKPVSITTSIAYYQRMLGSIGFQSSVYPVFSNLPIGDVRNKTIYETLPSAVRGNRDNYIIAVFFGTIHQGPLLISNVQKIKAKSLDEGKELLLLHIGRSQGVELFFSALQIQLQSACLVLGEKKGEDIAAFFKQVDVGLSTYGYTFLGKSGSISAMLYNALPVILLQSYKECNNNLPYVKYVDDLESITDFINQDKSFNSLFGIENTVMSYKNNFNKMVV